MLDSDLIIIRGLSGSAKSTLAKLLLKLGVVDAHFEADQLFQTPEGYKYDRSRAGEAHDICFDKVFKALANGQRVVVANTFVKKWEVERYTDKAKELGIGCFIMTLENDFGSTKGIPQKVMEDKKKVWERL